MPRKKPPEPAPPARPSGATPPPAGPRGSPAGFAAPPADGGLSIDRLAQAFAAMMGTAPPYAAALPADVVRVDASPDLDAGDQGDDAACPVSPLRILEALLFVGLPDGKPLASTAVAGLMRGVRPPEVDALARELQRAYRAENRPYQVVARDRGWALELRPEFEAFGGIVTSRVRRMRLDAESLEVLATVAWHGPVPRDRLVDLGCDARPAVLRQLVRRGLLELEGAAGEAGVQAYRTTPRFLELFRLRDLGDLPEPVGPPE